MRIVPRTPRSRFVVAATVSVVALLAALFADQWAFAHVFNPTVYERDWGRLLRVLGYLPTWILVGLAFLLHDRPSKGKRGYWLMAGATLGGAAAEVLKLVIRRARPSEAVARYVFRAWSDRPFSTGGLGMPSSHTMVAFGAAAVLARLFPRARVLWYALAAGCGVTRVLARAHWLSDVVAAAVASLAIVALLWRTRWVRDGVATAP